MSVYAALVVAAVTCLITTQVICASFWLVLHYAEYRSRNAQGGGGQGCEACGLPRSSHDREQRVPGPHACGPGPGTPAAERGGGPAPGAGDVAGAERGGVGVEPIGTGLFGALGSKA